MGHRLAVGCLLSFAGVILGGFLGGIIGAVIYDPNEFLGELDIYAGILIGAAIGGVVPLLAVLVRGAAPTVSLRRGAKTPGDRGQ